jgi:hypothetical protein
MPKETIAESSEGGLVRFSYLERSLMSQMMTG